MSTRTARSIAAAMLVVGGAASVTLLFTTSDEIPLVFAFTTFLVVGTLLVAKRREQPIGWLFACGALLLLVGDVPGSIVSDPSFPADSPWAGLLLTARNMYFFPAIGLLVTLPALLFPTGATLSRRWRPVVATAIAAIVIVAITGALSGTVCVDYDSAAGECLRELLNPWGIEGWDGADSAIGGLGSLMLGLATVAALVSAVLRFLRSRGTERAQMQWYALGVTTTVAVLLTAVLVDVAGLSVDNQLGQLLYSLGIAALPVTVAVAILRYRLYDIDRIVGRTVTYAVVIGLLAVVFLSIAALPTIVIGSAESPPWLIAASTLVAFALFDPLRRRVQRVVDRRFNRLPYDAEAVGNALAALLQAAVDPSAVSISWLEATERSLQPVSAAVWVKR